jgi:tetratricopeptide (TPR) repeat protein
MASDVDPPSEALAVAEPRWQVAASLESSRVGEVILLDRHGQVIGPGRVRWAVVRSWLHAGLIGSGGAVVCGMLWGSLLAGAAVGVTFAALVGWQMRHQPAFRRALALAAAGRRDEARDAFEALAARRLPGAYRRLVDMQLAALSWQQGHLDDASERYDRLVTALGGGRGARGNPAFWLCAFQRVQLTAIRGDVERAVRMRAELEDAPDGDYFQVARIHTDLTLAFYRDSADDLPDDLYDWAKRALETNRLGSTVVLLGWAFWRRGDEEMARHMLREAPARLQGHFLADSAPEVHRWMEERAAAWGLGDEDDEL